MSNDDHTHDELERLRQEAAGQEAKQEENLDPLATISDADLRIKIGQTKTADRQEDFLVRQGENIEDSLRHFDLKHDQAKAIITSYIATEADAIIRSRADIPRWRTDGHLHDAIKWLENADAILEAVEAHEHPPSRKQHDALSQSRKQTTDAWEQELTRRAQQRQEEEAEKEAERIAKLHADRQAQLD